jgi:hypothetical protein
VHAARLASSSTLKMEAVRYSERSVNLYWTTRRHIQEDSILLLYSLSGVLLYCLKEFIFSAQIRKLNQIHNNKAVSLYSFMFHYSI